MHLDMGMQQSRSWLVDCSIARLVGWQALRDEKARAAEAEAEAEAEIGRAEKATEVRFHCLLARLSDWYGMREELVSLRDCRVAELRGCVVAGLAGCPIGRACARRCAVRSVQSGSAWRACFTRRRCRRTHWRS
eukprot:7235550-Prymnesium_polylepis.1